MRVRHSGGAVINVSDEKGERLLAGGQFSPIDEEVETEEVETEEVETEEFDPSEHNVEEVQAYLADADDTETQRVLDAEKAGKNRSTLVD